MRGHHDMAPIFPISWTGGEEREATAQNAKYASSDFLFMGSYFWVCLRRTGAHRFRKIQTAILLAV